MKPSFKILAALTLLVGGAGRAKADLVIPVANSSFESPTLTLGGFTNDSIPGWTSTSMAGTAFGVFFPTMSGAAPELVGFPPDGNQVAYINGIAAISQDVGPVAAGATYTVSFFVAPRAELTMMGETEGWQVQLLAGTTPLTPTSGTSSGTVTEGSDVGFALTATSFTATAPLNATGDLFIQLSGTGPGSNQVLFDKVSLSESTVTTPEPSTLLLAGTGAVLGLGALWRSRRRGDLARGR
jgi:hypothetical protein